VSKDQDKFDEQDREAVILLKFSMTKNVSRGPDLEDYDGDLEAFERVA
jgi:hypothetical protein